MFSLTLREIREVAVLVLSLLGVGAALSSGQSIEGALVDESTGRPVVGAVVVLLGVDDAVLASGESGDDGSFVFAADPGDYRLHAVHSSYVESRTPWFYVGPEAPKQVRVLLEPAPVPVEGVNVSVSSHDEIMQRLGLREEEVGRRLISRETIARHPTARDVGEVLVWQTVPGVRVVRPANMAEESSLLNAARERIDLCVSFPRGKAFDGSQSCAVWVIDGRTTSDAVVRQLHPEDVETILVLTPPEATQLFGTGAFGGAVLVFTRHRDR